MSDTALVCIEWSGNVQWGFEDMDDARDGVRDLQDRGFAARVLVDQLDMDPIDRSPVLYGVEAGTYLPWEER